jgi:hypothetical protein
MLTVTFHFFFCFRLQFCGLILLKINGKQLLMENTCDNF